MSAFARMVLDEAPLADVTVCVRGWHRAHVGTPGGPRELLVAHVEDGPARRAVAAGAPSCRVLPPGSWSAARPPLE
jgi:hypothetical protein